MINAWVRKLCPVISIVIVGAVVGTSVQAAGRAYAQTAPVGLPQRIGIGLRGQPDVTGLLDWMPRSGIPWDYAYQYLAGGVNTGSGWATWTSPSGQFALSYAQLAAQHGYIPVFTYYELLQSNGPCSNCGEVQKDLANLNDAGTMATYYQDFALLMKRLGGGTYDGVNGFGKLAIVQVEPDLSGYATRAVIDNAQCYDHCAGQGSDPSLLRASVASSGFADVVGYPDTYQGFSWALLHLRDLYAPNVLLGFHISSWASGTDIGVSTDPSLNASALGSQVGAFAAYSGTAEAPPGTSTYDLLFNDVLDRDAGQYKAELGQNRWWDQLNVNFPNFSRWESYLAAVRDAAGGKSLIVWQVPLGNQYFRTENNAPGHYQDNRAEYFFSHMDELANIGVVGLLFGRGNGGSTTNDDAMHDGVSNPPSICSADGLSSGTVCNDHQSTYPDDDGGYIRIAAQRYYASAGIATAAPNPATIVASPSPTIRTTATIPAGAVQVGSTAPIRASVTSSRTVAALVDLEVHDSKGAKVFQRAFDQQAFADGETREYSADWAVPKGTADGSYTVKIGIFSPGWTQMLEWNDAAAVIEVTR